METYHTVDFASIFLDFRVQIAQVFNGKILISALIVGFLVAKCLQNLFVKKGIRPPGPRPWLILGNLPSLGGQLPHVSLYNLSREFGDLMYLRLGSVPCVVISSAAMAKEVFTYNDQNASSRAEGRFVEIVTGYKTLSAAPYGPYWRNLGKICNRELLNTKRVAAYEIVRTEEIHELVKSIVDASQKDGVVNLREFLTVMSRNNITKMLLRKRYFSVSDENCQKQGQLLDRLISLAFEQSGTFMLGDFVPYLRRVTKLLGYEKKLWEIRRLSFEVCGSMLDLQKRRQGQNSYKNSDDGPDFVDTLLSMHLEDGVERFSDETITLILLDMLIAGSETSATTIEWAMAELLRSPSLLKRAQAEVDVVIGKDRLVKESDLENLPYLQAIVKETLRLHAPVPLGLPREFMAPFKLAGYNFPAKTRLILNFWAIHRDPEAYARPHDFYPDRFLQHPEVTVQNYSHYELIPFGAGRRICPGLPLALFLVTSTLAHLLHAFEWSLHGLDDEKDLDMGESFGLTCPRRNPLMLTAKPRRSTSYFEMML